MTINTKARQLLDRRLDALHTLTDALDKITKDRKELDTREQQAWAAVTRAGWTDKDLAELGLAASKRPRTPRRRRSSDDGHPESLETPVQDFGDEHAA